MKTATKISAVLLLAVAIAAPVAVRAQTTPDASGGGSASQAIYSPESGGVPSSSPLRTFVSAFTGYSSFALAASSWLPESRAAIVSPWAAGYAVRQATTRHEQAAKVRR